MNLTTTITTRAPRGRGPRGRKAKREKAAACTAYAEQLATRAAARKPRRTYTMRKDEA